MADVCTFAGERSAAQAAGEGGECGCEDGEGGGGCEGGEGGGGRGGGETGRETLLHCLERQWRRVSVRSRHSYSNW